MPGRGERGGGDGERDAGAAPVELLGVDHGQQAVGVAAHAHEVVDAVEAPLAGGLDGLPRHALLAVVLVGHRPDHLGGEPAAVPLKLQLFVFEPEIHLCLHFRPDRFLPSGVRRTTD